jgi:hypothetical protein
MTPSSSLASDFRMKSRPSSSDSEHKPILHMNTAIETQQNPTEGKKCLKQQCSTNFTKKKLVFVITALLAIFMIGTGVGVNEYSNGAKNVQEKTSVTSHSTKTTTTTTTIQTKGTCTDRNILEDSY